MTTPGIPSATVWCRSESRYAERPVAFLREGQRVAVQRVLAQWREPSGPVFRVLAEDGGVYLLQYHEALAVWQLEP